jgi:hypothetical protein
MALPGIAASSQPQQVAQPSVQPSAHHRRGGAQTSSISDVDAQSASTPSTNRSTGRVGGKVDISA